MNSTLPLADGPTHAANKACFEGLMLQALAYGALVMLYIQITQVLIRRPKRGRMFWLIVFYSTALLPLATFAFVGRVIFMEKMFTGKAPRMMTAAAFGQRFSHEWSNVLSQACIMMIPWIGDLLMLYRLMVVWNWKWALAVVPGLMYLTRLGMAIPHLLTTIGNMPQSQETMFAFIYYGLCVTLNCVITILISVRLFMMRHKAERVLGNLQASLYNSVITVFVESGAFFSIWSLTYLTLRAVNSPSQDVFFQPYTFVLALTRMLIILRMAQDRAWTKEIITAADDGVLDWEVSSINSLSLNIDKGGVAGLGGAATIGLGGTREMITVPQNLPKKFRDDSLSSKSTHH